MLAFADGAIREVNVPVSELGSFDEVRGGWIDPYNLPSLLEKIFYYGQNDFQPHPSLPSVSIGDVVEVDNEKYRVEPAGWKKLED